MSNLFRVGGVAGASASFTIDDTGLMTVTDASGSTIFTFRTTNNDERIIMGAGVLMEPVQKIDMADATHALVLGAAATSGQTRLTGNLLMVDPSSGQASEILKLPAPVAGSVYRLTIYNVGGEDIVVQTAAGGTVGAGVTITPGGYAQVATEGTTWGGKAT